MVDDEWQDLKAAALRILEVDSRRPRGDHESWLARMRTITVPGPGLEERMARLEERLSQLEEEVGDGWVEERLSQLEGDVSDE